MISRNDIPQIRLANQQIAGTTFNTAKGIVSWMGAMQAQDYSMAKWAVGVRLPDSTDKKIETAAANGDILRTHILRPTWHFVSPEDIYWMLELTAPNIKYTLRSRHQQLELTETMLEKCTKIIRKILSNGNHLSRKAIMSELERVNIATNDQRSAHIMLRAELDGIVCSGKPNGKEQTYALLAERVPTKKPFRKDEACAELAKRYFTSHGPATLQDFIWWSGLSVSDAKNALESVKTNFSSEKVGSQTFWFANANPLSVHKKQSIYLLPAYDEYVISYKDRSAILPHERQTKAISNNGVFWPVIVINGKVIGTWKREQKKDAVVVETALFNSHAKEAAAKYKKSLLRFGDFMEKQAMLQ